MASKITVKAPSSTANLGPGFDVFGLAIDAFHDEVTLTKTKSGITIITDNKIPTNPEKNTVSEHTVCVEMIESVRDPKGIVRMPTAISHIYQACAP